MKLADLQRRVRGHWAKDFFTYSDASIKLSILVTFDSLCAYVMWCFLSLFMLFLFFNRINTREVGAALAVCRVWVLQMAHPGVSSAMRT
jgi:hypothetical protein